MAAPRDPTPAYARFRQSMNLDYEAWREGTPYDIAALSEVSDEERAALRDELCDKHKLDWRDVEALRVLGGEKAQARIAAAAKQTDGAGIEAFLDEIVEGWTPEIEARFIEKLENVQSMTGALDRLYAIAEEHQTPAVMAQLRRNARIHSDPTVRYSMAGFLLEITGCIDTRYTFDPAIRSHLLDLNSSDYKTYKAAVAWLEEKLDQAKSDEARD